MISNILSWGGCLLLLWGLKLIGDKRRAGFWIASAAEVAWIGWAVEQRAWAMVFMSTWILALYLRALWLWKGES